VAINPARDFGPRVAHWLLPIPGKGPSEFHYAWIPFFAPLLGGMAGAGLFKAIVQLYDGHEAPGNLAWWCV
jgi:glycerol uptake facilitator protein